MRQKIIGYRYVDLKTLLLSSEYRSGEDPQFLVALNGKIFLARLPKGSCLRVNGLKLFLATRRST